MWKGSGRSLLRTLFLENFKFTLFVMTPIVTASLFWNDRIVEIVTTNLDYLKRNPAHGERPPTNEQELRDAIAARRRAKEVKS